MFVPLKVYFQSIPSCPRNVKNVFEDESFWFWLKFIEAQLVISNKFVLKTESRRAAAFEVASDLAGLRNLVDHRKSENFIPFEARTAFEELPVTKQVTVSQDIASFYSSLSGYLEKCAKSLDRTEIFAWQKLEKIPDFEKDVMPAARYLAEHHSAEVLEMDGLFDELRLFQQFVEGSLSKWSASKISTEDRWLELLKSLKEQCRPVPNFSLLAQYALAVPGTSTEVERLFSIINDIWGPGKSRLDHKTLAAHLDIKYNSSRTCLEFFGECKNKKKMLTQVRGVQKYQEVSDSQTHCSKNSR